MRWRGEKRLHTIDEALANKELALARDQIDVKKITELVPRARRFVFSKEASGYMGNFIATCGDLIMLNRQFAIPPYEVTYIEFDIDLMIDAIERVDPKRARRAVDETRDTSVGLLLWRRGERVMVWECSSSAAGHTGFIPLAYEWGRPANEENIFAFGGHREEWVRLGLIIGSSVADMPDEETRNGIVNEVYFHMSDTVRKIYGKHPDMLEGTQGFVRNAWAALLLLNQPSHTRLSFQPPQAFLRGGKRRVYAAHNVVDIELRGFKTIRRAMLKQMRESPRRHEVRGHFRHYNLREDCSHEWPNVPDLNDRFVCHRCGGWRVWMREMLRGDASKGFVTKTYDVKAGQ